MMTKSHVSQPIPLLGINSEKIMRDAPKDVHPSFTYNRGLLYPTLGEWIDKLRYVNKREYYVAIENVF